MNHTGQQVGKLFTFPFNHQLTIHPPLGSQPGDKFEAITIPDDSLERGTIYRGDVVVIKRGLVRRGGLHAVLTPAGDKFVGFLVNVGKDRISIECNSDDYEPEIFKRDELKVLGRVVQVYPGGNVEERWELIRSRPAARKRIRRA